MSDAALRGIFQGLVSRVGGVDAAAAVIEAHCGTGHKGTVSKMCAGQLAVTVPAFVALESALGEYPMTEFLAQRRAASASVPASLVSVAAQSALLAGHMQSALMLAMAEDSDGGASITRSEAARVESSAVAMVEVAQRVLAHLHHVIPDRRGDAVKSEM